ncbi:MAG: ATP-binding protein [Thermodesulfovibrionales bacterium]|nr:ATP-binding protein [Thermodesulfovibrionales bacterium]
MSQIKPSLQDLIGIEYIKLGFYRELQEKIIELQSSNLQLDIKQQHLQSIIDGITDVMATVSLDFKITSINRFYYDFFEEKDPIGKLCFNVFRQRNSVCPECPIFTALQTNQVQRQIVMIPIRGKIHHFEITASPLRKSDSYPIGVLILKRDVTLEKEYQAKLYQAEKMSTIGLLAASVAHEMNNPLTAISGFAQGLRRKLPVLKKNLDKSVSDEIEEYLNIILKECKRCKDIVQNLLDLGRIRQQKMTLLDLNSIIIDTVQLIRHHSKKRKKDFIKLRLYKQLPMIYGDISQLKQVVLNLLLNALDATEKKGDIIITTSKVGKELVEMSIQDSGVGIPKEYLDRLFEPFFTTKPLGRGTGIGLSTCYNIIKNHEGDIFVSSELGKGTTFTVQLPIKSIIALSST